MSIVSTYCTCHTHFFSNSVRLPRMHMRQIEKKRKNTRWRAPRQKERERWEFSWQFSFDIVLYWICMHNTLFHLRNKHENTHAHTINTRQNRAHMLNARQRDDMSSTKGEEYYTFIASNLTKCTLEINRMKSYILYLVTLVQRTYEAHMGKGTFVAHMPTE